MFAQEEKPMDNFLEQKGKNLRRNRVQESSY